MDEKLRPIVVRVRLNQAEYDAFDALCKSKGLPHGALLRGFIYQNLARNRDRKPR